MLTALQEVTARLLQVQDVNTERKLMQLEVVIKRIANRDLQCNFEGNELARLLNAGIFYLN